MSFVKKAVKQNTVVRSVLSVNRWVAYALHHEHCKWLTGCGI